MALGVVGRTFHITQMKDLKAERWAAGYAGRMLKPFA